MTDMQLENYSKMVEAIRSDPPYATAEVQALKKYPQLARDLRARATLSREETPHE